MEKAGQTGRQTARGGEEHRKQQQKSHSHRTSGECSYRARPQGGSRAQAATLTKLRVAVRRPRRDATMVPLRLRPIRLGFVPSAGSTPKRRSCNAIGCRVTRRVSGAGAQGRDLRAREEHLRMCNLVEVGGVPGAVRPICAPLHVCVGGLGASLPPHPGYQPL